MLGLQQTFCWIMDQILTRKENIQFNLFYNYLNFWKVIKELFSDQSVCAFLKQNSLQYKRNWNQKGLYDFQKSQGWLT